MLACSVAEAAAAVAVDLATAVVAAVVIMTAAVVVVATVAATAASAVAPATVIIAAVAVATVAAVVAAAAVATRPPLLLLKRLPLRPLPLPRPRRLLPSNFGKELTSARFLPVPPLLVLAGGIQRPNDRFSIREAVFLRALVENRPVCV
jgi:hypothetical protein